MAQLFRPSATWVFRLALAGGILALAAAVVGGMLYVRSDAYWRVGVPADQPIPFRHDIHAGTLGLDCRFCHSTVERAASAGMPSANTCLACHAYVWSGASVLDPLRTSVALGTPVVWSSVHRLPAHAYFHHGAHVAAGVGCVACHGRVETMERTVKVATMSMGWCLECHRTAAGSPQPGPAPAPGTAALPAAGGNRTSAPTRARPVGGAGPRDALHATIGRLTDCSTCHR